MAYTRGNLAVKEKQSERSYQPQRYRETTKVVTRRSPLPVREKLLYMMTVIFCVAVMGGLLWQNVSLYNIKRQMFNLNTDIQAINAEVKELSIQKEKLEEQIPEKAQELGYVQPEVEGFHVNVPADGVETAKK
ncbi:MULTISPECIES: hypothetical protein [Paenibacillus]|jgi:cell division protein FtsL|uniref:Cell division protein FtsL n=2 Tax=Paenibacillus barengoltzii TaxID=343517 RepID=R9LQA2_9BACL|nr:MULTISPECIES: hypothetical protein [Paenibacillus]EOS57882.1 hypothetical protein C812_00928 [Paenibacillus barengoltzii G22]MEC2344191.1 hypothetical protein [Paenibacillus barengoltzii]SMF40839.1 hypothetical protein SAMN02744124_02882 [Paenibacillus barengoltzii J12]